MKNTLVVFVVLFSISALAGFGGSRSSGGRSSSSSSSFRSSPSSSRSGGGSYFGGSRSGGSNVTISRPAPKAPVTQAAPPPVTIVNHPAINSSGGFLNGFLWGHLLSNNNQTVIAGQPMQAGTVIMDSGHGFFFYLFMLIVVCGFLWICLKVFRIISED